MPKMGLQARRERRQELVDAGWRCVERTGYHKLTVDDVCTEANLSKGAFYTHFEQKQDLLLALLDDEGRATDAIIAEVTDAAIPGTERIRRYLRAVLEQGEDHAKAQLRADLWAEVRHDPVVQERFAEGIRRRRQLLALWITQSVAAGEMVDLPPNAFASVLLALGDGLMLHAAIDPGGFRWSNIRTAVAGLVNAVRA
jgi:AcrR family transcriptional regulator